MTSTSLVARTVSRLRRHLTYANVAATLALVMASSGVAYAANTVRSTDIVDGAVKSVDIATNGVQSIDIKNGGIALGDLSNGARNTLTAGAVDHLDDLDGLACSVGANPGTVTVTSTDAAPGIEDIGLTCVQTPLECAAAPPTGNHIAGVQCDPFSGNWVITCEPGFGNVNGLPGDGCEVQYSEEVCNSLDDDGDGQADEGLSYSVDNGQVDCNPVSGVLELTCTSGFIPVSSNIDDGCMPEP